MHIDSGKVREVYRLDADHLVIVASDRISAFDVVLGEAIPYKPSCIEMPPEHSNSFRKKS